MADGNGWCHHLLTCSSHVPATMQAGILSIPQDSSWCRSICLNNLETRFSVVKLPDAAAHRLTTKATFFLPDGQHSFASGLMLVDRPAAKALWLQVLAWEEL